MVASPDSLAQSVICALPAKPWQPEKAGSTRFGMVDLARHNQAFAGICEQSSTTIP